jgi:hypothetical protein
VVSKEEEEISRRTVCDFSSVLFFEPIHYRDIQGGSHELPEYPGPPPIRITGNQHSLIPLVDSPLSLSQARNKEHSHAAGKAGIDFVRKGVRFKSHLVQRTNLDQ